MVEHDTQGRHNISETGREKQNTKQKFQKKETKLCINIYITLYNGIPNCIAI